MNFQSIADAKEYFDKNVLIYIPGYQELEKTREELFNEWLNTAQPFIQDIKDTEESDEYDQSNHHQQ